MNIPQLIESLNNFIRLRQFNDGITLLRSEAARSQIDESIRALFISRLAQESGKTAIAIEYLRPFAQVSPDHAFTWGKLLHETGQIELAQAAWEPFWSSFEPSNQLPLYLQSLLVSPNTSAATLYYRHAHWASKILDQFDSNVRDQELIAICRAKPQIHVAYFAASWDGTTIRRTFVHHLKHHNKKQFRIFGYSSTHIPSDLEGLFDHCRIVPHDVDQFRKLVSEDTIDIFLDTTGISPGSKFPAMAKRVAPLQYSYLNHFSTTAIPNVDFVIGDQLTPSIEQESFFSESISRMKGCFLSYCYDTAIPYEESPPCLSRSAVVFGCLSSQGKIGSLFLKACAEILSKSVKFRLLFRNHFLTDLNNKRLFIEIASSHGIDPSQLILLDGCSHDEIFQTYSQIDISLDTFPYNGGNTVSESLWQGVPVISLRGQNFVGQYAASILIHSGLSELVTYSVSEFVDCAINLASDTPRLLDYRRSLRSKISGSRFNDGKHFAERLEEMFIRDYCSWQARNC